MAQTLITIDNPIAFIIKSTTDATFNLLQANFNTGVVTSAILSDRAKYVLTERLQDAITKVPVIGDLEAGFAGLVRSLLVATLFEPGTFGVGVSYASPVATYVLSGLPATAHIGISIPMSTSAPYNGNP